MHRSIWNENDQSSRRRVKIPLILTIYGHLARHLNFFNFTPFNPIKMGFSTDIIEIYAENQYKFFTISYLNFYSNTKFGHHL